MRIESNTSQTTLGAYGKPPRIDWQSVVEITVPAIKCPHCETLKPITVRSMANGDGSRTRQCVCRRCSQPFIAIIEIEDC